MTYYKLLSECQETVARIKRTQDRCLDEVLKVDTDKAKDLLRRLTAVQTQFEKLEVEALEGFKQEG